MVERQSLFARMRDNLLQQQAEIERRLESGEHYGLASSLRDNTGELSSIDNHPGDVASEVYERGKDVALLEQDDLHLVRIGQALAAMDAGTYGTCLTCGKPIPAERLEAIPETLYCVDHSPRQYVSQRRPAEEDYLDNPFGRSSRDDYGYNGFDGEDAWQIVESWGNSDSPAMAERPGDNYDRLGTEDDENDGYVEPLESFLATDITGRHVSVVRNREYSAYMHEGEGATLDDLADDSRDELRYDE
ncbi:TraR/DksA C4-type zinc finger protein [Paenibacillus beijingensis]|uniref:Molecular chaperone DnaK n=1 Tax=Paenibacillus beijingensis TaxID=1126833 RepID=A0A0D5NMJ6_9BACL|nr:TraR/DksA C4-type zinc finger protein [Paenibacillus beijingensis]AJY76385.1 molecular chaperone DnaK [Paenibacillus beijingensis]